jgi:PRC-barrel domain
MPVADYEQRSDGYTAIEDEYSGYTVLDPNGEKIGKVDDLFLDENNEPEYVGVKMGFLGTSSTLSRWTCARWTGAAASSRSPSPRAR